MNIRNYIRINGKYVKQEDIPPDQMREISRVLITRLCAGFGYVPVTDEADKDKKGS